jgi:polysaccharide deacetylase 2 family uncharacterized protein YibQ
VTFVVNFFVLLRNSFISRSHADRLRLFTLGLALAVAAGSCHKPAKRPGAAEIHVATREFAAAASSAAPGADVRSELSASDHDPDSTDHLDIAIHPSANETSNGAASTARLLQALGRVATRHRLTQDSPSESREGILFTYRRAGFATHTIHIHFGPAAAWREPVPGAKAGHALLAIILDDLGNDRSAADAIFALPYPLTISVLPDRPHSADIAEEAHRRGYQVMLHLPMESVGKERPESREIRPGMSAGDVTALVNEFLEAVPAAAGVNNHQGSQSTANAALMDELMPVLRDHKLFYIDSRTTAATVAYDTAHRLGVRAAFRNVPFLDDVAEAPAVRKQLQLALRDAREKGEAVAIGHPHPATLKALSEVLPQAKAQGVRLVFASELAH